MKRFFLSVFIFLLIICATISCIEEDLLRPDAGLIKINVVNPDSGRIGDLVIIEGRNLQSSGNDSVFFNGIQAEIIEADTHQLQVIVPPNATSGAVSVVIDGQLAIGPNFNVLSFFIDQVQPDSGFVGSEVTITGNNFGFNQNEVVVKFNQDTAIIDEINDNEIITTVPEGATTGIVSIIKQQNNLLAEGPVFNVLYRPLIDSIAPTEGPPGTEFSIYGHYFSNQLDSNIVLINDDTLALLSADTSELVAVIDCAISTGNVKVTVNGETAEGPVFTVTQPNPPTITFIEPDNGEVGISVTITGTNFSPTPADNEVQFNGVAATVNSASETELTVTVPKNATTGNVTVTVGGETAQGPVFTVIQPTPTITALDPTEGAVGSTVTITGTNFSADASENQVSFNGVSATVTSATNTQLEVVVPNSATTGDVTVTIAGNTSNAIDFSVIHGITGISPSQGGFGTNVTINGSGFGDSPDDLTVEFNGVPTSVSSGSDNQLVVKVPKGAGTGTVTVTKDGKTVTGPVFTYTLTLVVSDFSGTGVAGLINGDATVAQYHNPARGVIGPDDSLYVTEVANHAIRKVNNNGAVSTFAGNGTSGATDGTGINARFNQPLGIAVDANGDLIVAEFSGHRIRKINSFATVTTYAGFGQASFIDDQGVNAGFAQPADVVVAGNGEIFVADFFNNAIRRIDVNGNVTTFAGGTQGFADSKGTAASFDGPIGLGIDANDNLYVADFNNHAIRKITPDGVVSTIAGDGTEGYVDGNVSNASFNSPYDVEVGDNGDLYIPDLQNNVIRVIRNESVVDTYAGAGNVGDTNGTLDIAEFNAPTGFLYVNSNLQYVFDHLNNKIRKITRE